MLFLAATLATGYWLVVPRGLRLTYIALSSSLVFFLLGGSFPYFVLLIVMVNAVYLSTRPSQTTSAHPKWTVGLAATLAACIVFLIAWSAGWMPVGISLTILSGFAAMLLALILAGLWFSRAAIISTVRNSFSSLQSLSEGNARLSIRWLRLGIAAASVVLLGWSLRSALRMEVHQLRLILSLALERSDALPPFRFQLLFILAGMLVFVLAILLTRWMINTCTAKSLRWVRVALIALILLVFCLVKNPMDKLPDLVFWVGFSYLSFRQLHVLIDANRGEFYACNWMEMFVYIFFFPALLVGPIDRLPRMLGDLRTTQSAWKWDYLLQGGWRILLGAFYKFVLADLVFSTIALNSKQVFLAGAAFAWLQLLFFGLKIFFDFAGFTHIAIGTGMLIGITLPENFQRPYLQQNLTKFWQSWHMTLSGWLRFYIFTPLSRKLLRSPLKRSPNLTVLIAQVVTMGAIGLWHGFSINYLLWGLWHASGLFIHKLYSDWLRRTGSSVIRSVPARLVSIASWAITFLYVSLGWVFFVMRTPADAWLFFGRLVGR